MLRALVDAGADLILGGHIHQSAVSERHEFEVVGDEARTAVVAVAPGSDSPARGGSARRAASTCIEATESAIVRPHVRLVARRLDARGRTRLSAALTARRQLARARSGQRPVLDEAAVQVEQQRRADQGEDDPGRVAEEDPRDQAADQVPASPSPIVREDPHRVRPRQGEPRERADDQAREGEKRMNQRTIAVS